MDNNGNILAKIAVKSPERWRLALRLDSSSIEYMLYAPDDSNSLIAGSIALAGDGSYLKRVEDSIYDHAALVGDFASVTVTVDNDIFTVVPNEVAADVPFSLLFPDFDGEIRYSSTNYETVVYGMDRGLCAFFERTYLEVKFCHSLEAIHGFYRRKAVLGNGSKLYAVLRPDRVMLCCYAGGNLEAATAFTFRHVNDAAFFILNMWNTAQLDAKNDELYIAGDTAHRGELIEILKQYVAYVIPAVVPASMLRIGKEVTDISFDLLISALCE